jgi:hypothetical protein
MWIKSGRVDPNFGTDDQGTSSVGWWLYSAKMTDEEIVDSLNEEIDIRGHYSGPGRSFSGNIMIKRGPFKVLVTKFSGLDI